MSLVRYFVFMYACLVWSSLNRLMRKLHMHFEHTFNEIDRLSYFKVLIDAYCKCDLTELLIRLQRLSYNLPELGGGIVLNLVIVRYPFKVGEHLYDWYVDRNKLYIAYIGFGGEKYSGLESCIKYYLDKINLGVL
jgi:hypothetical protein